MKVSDHLTKKQIELKKDAQKLKKLNKIYNFWTYRGEVYYSLEADSGERLSGNSEAFQKLRSSLQESTQDSDSSD